MTEKEYRRVVQNLSEAISILETQSHYLKTMLVTFGLRKYDGEMKDVTKMCKAHAEASTKRLKDTLDRFRADIRINALKRTTDPSNQLSGGLNEGGAFDF